MIYKSYIVEKKINDITQNIILFYGENLGLKNHFKSTIKSFDNERERILFSQDEVLMKKNLLINEICNDSLFEKKKLIIIEDVSDKLFQFIEEIVSNISDQKILLFSNILDKKSKIRSYFEKSTKTAIIACYDDNEITIKNLIKESLNDYKNLSPINVNLIAQSVNLDRDKLNNELQKIKAYFRNKILNTEELLTLLNLNLNEDFSILKDEALLGNVKKTNELLNTTVIDEDKSLYYINSVNQRMTKLMQIIKNSEKSNFVSAVNNLKPPIFWKEKPKFIGQLKKWNKSKIIKILNETYKLEKRIKSDNLISKPILIKKLILDITSLASS